MNYLIKEHKRIEDFSKVRRIKTTQKTDRSILYTNKSRKDGFVEAQSLTEEGLYFLLDHDPHCIDMESQPVKIPKDSQKKYFYYPDTWAKFDDGQQFIFDVKHTTYYKKLARDPKEADWWKDRIKSVQEYCDINGLNYEIVTEAEIRTERLENIGFFMKNKRKPELLSRIHPIIETILEKNGGMPRIDLSIKISKKLNLDEKQVIPVIDYMIYWDFFLLNYETKIDNYTILKLRANQSSKLLPSYLYLSKFKKPEITPQPVLLTPNPKNPNYDDASQREFLSLPIHIREIVLKRIKSLEVFNSQDFSTVKVKEQARKFNKSYVTLYRWKEKFEQKGWVGLIPNYEKKGRKRSLESKLERLIKQVVNERYLTHIQPSIQGCYNFLLVECEKEEIDPPLYITFYRRLKEISDMEATKGRRGGKVLRDEYKLLEGVYPFGIYPLDTIEFDHTPLDIILVDRIDRKPIGRPVLTLAFDVYSRMIYGYYLSFDPPSYLTVAMCFLMGILPKDDITDRFGTDNKWEIYGIPKTILVDNAKEFRGTALANFCRLYDIVLRSNPVKKPDMKPYVERVFRTINEAIRDDLIEGYILPLEERRKTQYNPEKKAEMTIEEFEQWLVLWIVDEYHQRKHGGLKEKEGLEINPSNRFKQGLVESDGRVVGLPTILTNIEQIRYDLLPSVKNQKRQLNRNGIKALGLVYNAPIIGKLRATHKNKDEKYIIKYDPRDIREVYLWAEQLNRYYNIPLKKSNYIQFQINPNDPNDYPLSKKELEVLKRNIVKKSPNKEYNLVKSMINRQELIEEARQKTKTIKKSRKYEEVRIVHKVKATSTEIRKDNKLDENNSAEMGKGAEELDVKWLKKHAFPSKSRWKEGEF